MSPQEWFMFGFILGALLALGIAACQIEAAKTDRRYKELEKRHRQHFEEKEEPPF